MSNDVPLLSVVAGARPNFMKVGPVIGALKGRAKVEFVHTGQHYDENMSATFLRDLELPEPDVNLGVGSGTHGEQTGAVLVAYERLLMDDRPDAVVVVGDVNSTLAAALAAAKLHIPVAHVEAGLRSNDWSMPEEVNRVLTDRLSQWLFTPSADADANLGAEGVAEDRIHLVGNVMADTLLRSIDRARATFSTWSETNNLRREEFGVVTLHRPSSVDDATVLAGLVRAMNEVSQLIPLVFSAHPRTAKRIGEFGLETGPRIHAIDPLGYLSFIGLVDAAAIVLTDSGGLQEEATILGVPCLTLRDSTERPITVDLGTNRLVGTHPEVIVRGAHDALELARRSISIPLWDGRAGDRIASVLLGDLE